MDKLFGITEKTHKILIEVFKDFSEVEQVVIFGSRAKGNYKQGSDIDLALKGKNVTPETALNVSVVINERKPVPYFVDVISYSHITNPELKEHIDRVGLVLYSKA